MFDLLSLGYLGVFLLSFLLNMLPFMAPSNLLLAGSIGVALPWLNPVLVGLLVAVASSFAKLIHFYLTFFVGRALKISEDRLKKYRRKAGRIGPALIFLAAASPIPDEPIVIPLGLVKYNPAKFFLFFLAGKTLITVLGALAGSSVSHSLEDIFGNPILVVLSVILTVVTTFILAKVNLENLTKRVMDSIRGNSR